MLEIGAGEGALGEWLARNVDYTGVERDAAARAVAAHRVGAERMLAELPASGSYDLICAFEVLEHIEDDLGALLAWKRLLRRGGHLLLSVPAHQRRYGASDEFVGHYRRYDRDVLTSVLDGAGFEPTQWSSYGIGIGQAMESARNAILSRRARPTTAEGTAGSGRLFQPKSRAHLIANYALAFPFRIAQRPFANTEHGMGYVVLAVDRS